MALDNRIVQLSAAIHDHTKKVDAYLAANNQPTPSFDVSCPPKYLLPLEIQASRDAVLEATDELTALMLGPVESLIPPVCLPYIIFPISNSCLTNSQAKRLD